MTLSAIIRLFVLSALCLLPLCGADLLDGKKELADWRVFGGATVEPGAESGLWVLKAAKKNIESGFYAGGMALANGEYVLKIRARVKNGYLKVLMKHGSNKYGLLSEQLKVSGGFRDYEFRVKEEQGGNHGSVWLVVTGEAEVFAPTLQPVESAAVPEAVPAEEVPVPGPDMLAGCSDVTAWRCFGNATAAPGAEKGLWVVKTGKKNTESGFYTGGLQLDNGEYVLKIRARVKSGYMKVLMKHGINEYGLMSEVISAGKDFREYEFRAKEEKGGKHGSVWLVVTGEAEVFVPVVQKIEMKAASAVAMEPVAGPDLLSEQGDVTAWRCFGNATAVPGAENGLWVVKTGKKNTESGFYAGGLQLDNGEYVLKIRARVKSGYMKVLMKHGINEYGLMSEVISVGKDFREYEFRVKEEKGGKHGSVWLVVTGEAEVFVPVVQRMELRAAAGE